MNYPPNTIVQNYNVNAGAVIQLPCFLDQQSPPDRFRAVVFASPVIQVGAAPRNQTGPDFVSGQTCAIQFDLTQLIQQGALSRARAIKVSMQAAAGGWVNAFSTAPQVNTEMVLFDFGVSNTVTLNAALTYGQSQQGGFGSHGGELEIAVANDGLITGSVLINPSAIWNAAYLEIDGFSLPDVLAVRTRSIYASTFFDTSNDKAYFYGNYNAGSGTQLTFLERVGTTTSVTPDPAVINNLQITNSELGVEFDVSSGVVPTGELIGFYVELLTASASAPENLPFLLFDSGLQIPLNKADALDIDFISANPIFALMIPSLAAAVTFQVAVSNFKNSLDFLR